MQRIIFYELAMTPPVPMSAVQAGDRFVIDEVTHNALHLRGVTIVSERATDWPGTYLGESPAVPANDGIYHLVQGRLKPMAGQVVSLTRVNHNSATGVVVLFFSNGNTREYQSWAEMVQVVRALDEQPDTAETLLLLKAARTSPDGTNMEAMVGAQVSVNGHASEPVVFTPPE